MELEITILNYLERNKKIRKERIIMNVNQDLGRNDIFATMNSGGAPYGAYIKTILGKVLVHYWDNFTETPAETILQGDPKRKDESCIVKVWTEREDAYFKRMNNKHFKAGILVPYAIPADQAPAEREIEQSTDEELKAIVSLKFLALQAKLNKIDSEAVLYRMIGIAEDLDKSEKITNAIKARISEVQAAEYTTKKTEEE